LYSDRLMRNTRGFTLIEAIVAIAIFSIIMAGVLGLFSMLTRATKAAREQIILSALSVSRLEIMRNLPYDDVGTASGNPNGSLPDFANPDTFTHEGANFEVYYEVTYVDDPADGTILAGTDPVPSDYKQVKMYIKNVASNKITSFVTNVSPRGLEGLSNAGALFIHSMDAAGQPVPNASISIVNNSIVPNINLSRQTDAQGNWIEVGLPASVNGYHIVATKSGYSTDSTYPISGGNPNPVKPDSTVQDGQVTQISFAIDIVSDLAIRTLNATCGDLSGVDVNVAGSKLIGAAPDVYKYDQDHSSSGGAIALNNIEWDVYVPTLLTGQGLMLYGTSPIQQVNVLPGANQTFTLILGPSTANSLLVIVKNAATLASIEGAQVTLSRTTPSFSEDKVTGGSVWNQSDWSGGAGQDDYLLPNQYFSDDGNVGNNGPGVTLSFAGSNYVPAGQLTSSTFDTGGSSNYTTVEWEPTSQNPATILKFQVASNSDNTTWDFKGPDGTSGTYYTVPGTSLHSSHNGDRYIRYRAYLETSDGTFTPVLSNVNVNYVSGCNTPGQVVFPGLSSGNNYDLAVTMPGYQNYTANSLNINGNQVLEVLMTP
jgi:prepilin-type N-terminal cleavage/methylation domain-containing protein